MKKICTVLFTLVIIISCTGEPTLLNATMPSDSYQDKVDQKMNELKNSGSFSEGGIDFLKVSKRIDGLKINGYVRSIFEDKAGNFWFATYGDGICRFDGKQLKYLNKKEGVKGNIIREIAEDANGNIWFATNSGLFGYEKNEFTNYTEKHGYKDIEIGCVHIDTKGIIWLGIEGGILTFNGSDFTKIKMPASTFTPENAGSPLASLISSIAEDKKGNIWIGTNGSGVYRYDGKKMTQLSEKEGLCNNFVLSVVEDSHGKIWISTRFGGVSCYDGNTFTHISMKNGLSSNFIWSVLEDKNGNMWFATAGRGVDKYDGKTFSNFLEQDGLASDYVQSIMEDKEGHIWFGTGRGVTRFDGKKFRSFPNDLADGC